MMGRLNCKHLLLRGLCIALLSLPFALFAATQSSQPVTQDPEEDWQQVADELDALLKGANEDDDKLRAPTPGQATNVEDSQVVVAAPQAQNQQPVNLPGNAQTSGEKAADIDRQLEEGYQVFEGVILREKEYVRRKENENPAGIEEEPEEEDTETAYASDEDIFGDSGYGKDEGLEPSGSGQEPPSENGDDSRDTAENQGEGDTEEQSDGKGTDTAARTDKAEGGNGGGTDESGEKRESVEDEVIARETPADIPDGSNDDATARSLRKAAEQETDPELRAILWEAYRKYKEENG